MMPHRNTIIIFAVIGAVLLASASYGIYLNLDFLARCLETKGIVIGYHERTGVMYGSAWSPVFQFVDNRTGEVITVISRYRGLDYRVGMKVDVLYDPLNPHKAYIKPFSIWDGGVALGLSLGVGFSLVAVSIVTLPKIASKYPILENLSFGLFFLAIGIVLSLLLFIVASIPITSPIISLPLCFIVFGLVCLYFGWSAYHPRPQ